MIVLLSQLLIVKSFNIGLVIKIGTFRNFVAMAAYRHKYIATLLERSIMVSQMTSC